MISNFIRSYFLLKKYPIVSCVAKGRIYLDLILKFLFKQFLTKSFLKKEESFLNLGTRATIRTTFLLGPKIRDRGIASSGLIPYKLALNSVRGNSDLDPNNLIFGPIREIKLGPLINSEVDKNRTFFFTLTNYLIPYLKLIYNILVYIISKYKYIILFIYVIYIICIVLDWCLDSTLSSYLFPKYSHILSLQFRNNFISNLIIIFTYLYSLETTLYLNITLLGPNNLGLDNINYIIIFIVIYITFSFILFVYLLIILKIKPFIRIRIRFIMSALLGLVKDRPLALGHGPKKSILFPNEEEENLFIKILLKQFNLIKSFKNLFILIFNLLNLDFLGFEEYYLSFLLEAQIFGPIINKNSHLKNMISLSLANNDYLIVRDDLDQIAEGEDDLLSTDDLLFNNFNELNLEDRKRYIINKFENKGMIATFYSINWLMDKIILDTEGTKHNVEFLIDKYLNQMLNLERVTQLKSFAFHREKPFLRHLLDPNNTPLEYPYVIPAKNTMTESDMYDLKDALIKNEEETVNQD